MSDNKGYSTYREGFTVEETTLAELRQLAPVARQETLAAAVEFLQVKGQRSEHTRRAYQRDLALLLRYLGTMDLRDVRPRHLVEFAGTLQGSDATRARVLAVVRSFFAWLQRWGAIELNPAGVLDLPRREDDPQERCLSDEEVLAILAQLKRPRDYAIGCMLAYTGARVEELAGLEWRRLFQDRGGLVGVKLNGKGRKERRIWVPAEAWEAMLAYREAAGLATELGADGGPVFRSQKGGALTARQVERIIQDAATRARVQLDADGRSQVTPHWFRHTALTNAIEHGAPVNEVRETAGHASLHTTSRYTHSRQLLARSATRYIRYGP